MSPRGLSTKIVPPNPVPASAATTCSSQATSCGRRPCGGERLLRFQSGMEALRDRVV